jgi:hypothetical protein
MHHHILERLAAQRAAELRRDADQHRLARIGRGARTQPASRARRLARWWGAVPALRRRERTGPRAA